MSTRGALRHSQQSSTSRTMFRRTAVVLWFGYDFILINYGMYESTNQVFLYFEYWYLFFAMTCIYRWVWGFTHGDNSRSPVSSLFPPGTGLRFYCASYCSSCPLFIHFHYIFPSSCSRPFGEGRRHPIITTVMHTPMTLTPIQYIIIKCTSQLLVRFTIDIMCSPQAILEYFLG